MIKYKKLWLILSIVFSINSVLSSVGQTDPQRQSFEEQFTDLLKNFHIPGASVAVMKEGKLVYAKGFGVTNLKNNEPVNPSSLFRIASVTKILTAIATMQLVEKKKLSLDDKAFSILNHIKPFPGMQPDPRVYTITIRDLLEMSSGWKGKTGDNERRVSKTLHNPFPPSREDVLRYMIGTPLDFDPGTQYAYTNFNYNLLGAIIEKVTGQSYEAYIRENILAPLGIHGMRMGNLRSGPGEVSYYTIQNGAPVLFPGQKTFHLHFASGAWIASPSDLVKIFSSVKELGKLPHLLSPKTVDIMMEKPKTVQKWTEENRWYYALGWQVINASHGQRWQKNGVLPGTSSFVALNPEGVAVAGIVNGSTERQGDWERHFYKLLIEAAALVAGTQKD